MNYLALALIIIVVVALYYGVQWITDKSLTSGLNNLNTVQTYSVDKYINNPTSPNVSYQIWTTIHAYPDPSATIFKREVKLEISKAGNLNVAVLTSGADPTYKQIATIPNFPLNTWAHIAINLTGKKVEIYLNGKLVLTRVSADTVATTSTMPLTLGDSKFDTYCYSTKFIRLAYNLDVATIYNNYLKGPGVSSANPTGYGVNLVVKNPDTSSKTIQLF